MIRDPLAVATAEVKRTARLDRPLEVLSRPYLGRMIDAAATLLAFQATVMAAQNKPAPRDEPKQAVAYVNWGRILIDCPCGDAPVVDPDWGPLACCLGCGRIYRNILLPANMVAIEAALLKRPDMLNRNWNPGETLQQLLADNAAHGL